MKIVTIGLSPYLLTSQSKLNAHILKHLLINGHSVSSIVWGHDVNYFPPQENTDGNQCFYYEVDKYKIPIIPFNLTDISTDVCTIYEILKVLTPEMVITIGNYNDFLYMKAIKQLYPHNLKWIFVLANYVNPINENNLELANDADGILCTSPSSYEYIKSFYCKDTIDWEYVGCSSPTKYTPKNINDKFRIMASAKNMQSDNLPTLIEAVAQIRQDIPNIELYIHANIDDTGDYNFQLLKNRYDPNEEFLRLPHKFVSIIDGFEPQEYVEEIKNTDLFVSIPMFSATSMTVFEALQYGCYPLMSECGSNIDISAELSKFLGEGTRNRFTVPCINLLTTGESYLNICYPEALKEKIKEIYISRKKIQGYNTKFYEFTLNHPLSNFLSKIDKMIQKVKGIEKAIYLENVV